MQKHKHLGRPITRSGPDAGKIVFQVGTRLLFAAGVCCMALFETRSQQRFSSASVNVSSSYTADMIVGISVVMFFVLTYFVFTFRPLIHCRDSIIFYENGMEICKKTWTFSELGDIYFTYSNRILFSFTYMNTSVKKFDVTYIKDAERNYHIAYFDTI